jgi:hypothetical protein
MQPFFQDKHLHTLSGLYSLPCAAPEMKFLLSLIVYSRYCYFSNDYIIFYDSFVLHLISFQFLFFVCYDYYKMLALFELSLDVVVLYLMK